LGSIDDGGYVVPKKVLKNTDYLISLGISDNWDFERHFAQLSNCSVAAYDYSIDNDFWINRFKKDLFKFVCLKIFKPKKLNKMFQYLDFIYFFKLKKKNSFLKKKIGIGKNLISLKNIFHNIKKANKIFLKIDIEGSEYQILDQINHFKNITTGIVIEFHETSKNMKKIISFIDKIKDQLSLVHIHGNNYSVKGKNQKPEALELTFFSNKLFFKENRRNNKSYPINGLDYPNSKRSKDLILLFN
jgi:hypothetical protein